MWEKLQPPGLQPSALLCRFLTHLMHISVTTAALKKKEAVFGHPGNENTVVCIHTGHLVCDCVGLLL